MKRAVIGFISLILLAFAPFGFLVSQSWAQLVVGVKGGNFKPISIAIVEFGAAGDFGKNISDVISADLERSGLFRPLDPKLFIDDDATINKRPNFGDWRKIDAHGLVVGAVTKDGANRFRADVRLWDVTSQQQLFGRQFSFTKNNWRRVAHIIADSIYQRMTGEAAYFNSRIVFVDETGPATKRIKRLAIMDQDGANLHYLTDGSELAVTPRFSANRQEITYMAYVNGVPRVYIQNLEQGKRRLVGSFPNMTIAPRFSPDGSKLIMSLLTEGGNANLYVMDLRRGTTQRLTAVSAIDSSASYAPDGKQIVFSSDRSGRSALYIMAQDGSNVKRISRGLGSYLTPVWSPRGDYIAFTKLANGVFSIGVMRPDGSGERLLTSGFHNEGPTWAPNGRVLMFFRQKAGWPVPKIFSIDLTGRNERQITTPNGASDPAWSSLLDAS